ncbi:MAG: hypothetical protein OER04_08935, partial [Cyclobacteriaceae bacterium]|nr:hypothetical protein [Cyclobacteriaceae bacterium]
MRRITLFSIALLLSTVAVMAQPGWNWGSDAETAKERNALYNDFRKNKDFKSAVEPLEWLLTNTPDLNKAIYIHGTQIYDALQAAESDDAQKRAYQKRCLELYDERIKYFKEEASVLNRKAYKAYK